MKRGDLYIHENQIRKTCNKAAFTQAILRVGGPLHLTADTQKAVGLVELERFLLQLASDTVIYATANQWWRALRGISRLSCGDRVTMATRSVRQIN